MLPSRPSGRKRWNIHDGPQGSLRRLRNQLAEDGCAESQVVLAKQLLEEKCELEADKVSNFKQALEWLICATEQGHPEARRMLKRCVRSGVIGENTAAIVRAKTCLAASRQETVARKAARDLFASISNGEQYITTTQLEQRIREMCSVTLKVEQGPDSDSPDDEAPEEEPPAAELGGPPALEPMDLESGDHNYTNGILETPTLDNDEDETQSTTSSEIQNLTIDNLVTAAVDYCHGELPLVTYDLTLTDPPRTCLDHIPLLQQAFLHPFLFIQVLYLKLLYHCNNCNFYMNNVEFMFILVGYLYFNNDNLSNLVPLGFFYASFVAMVILTFKMFHAKRQFIDFRKWSGLFLRYSEGSLQPEESENLFVRNNLGPFLKFFVALFVNLFLYPFISTQCVPFSEFCVISFFLMFLTLFSFGIQGRTYPDMLALISFAINVLAKYPYEKDTVVHQGWRFLDLTMQNYASYLLGNSIEFCLNARIFFSLLIPFILVLMAKRDSWSGFFKCAVPHFVTLSWLQMFITCSHGCTTYGLIRATLGLVCSLLFLPLMGVVTLTLPLFAFLQYFSVSRIFYVTCLVLGLGVALGFTCVLAKIECTKKFVGPVQLTIGCIALIYFSDQALTNLQDDGTQLVDIISTEKIIKNDYLNYMDKTNFITWQEYYNQCHAPSWNEKNMADTQIKCSVLEGSSVNWGGYVKEVKLSNVRNKWEDFATYLPPFVREYYNCYYGEEYSTFCDGLKADFVNDCEFVKGASRKKGRRCHLNNLNEYTYEIKLSMEASGGILKRHAEITLILDHHFTNYSKLLRADDRVQFKGILLNDASYNIGTRNLKLKGYEISCLECKTARGGVSMKAPAVSRFAEIFKTVVNNIGLSSKYVLNFILNPVFVLK